MVRLNPNLHATEHVVREEKYDASQEVNTPRSFSQTRSAPGDRVKAASHFGFLVGEKLLIHLMFTHLQAGVKQKALQCEIHKLKLLLSRPI